MKIWHDTCVKYIIGALLSLFAYDASLIAMHHVQKKPTKTLGSKGLLTGGTHNQHSTIAQNIDISGTTESTNPTTSPSTSSNNATFQDTDQPEHTNNHSESPDSSMAVVGKVDDPEIIFNFENADLQNLVTYIETIFDVTFIPDDSMNPILQTGKAVSGNKISFKTNKPLSKQQAWSLFTTFLNMAGLSFYKDGAAPNVYRITSINNVKKSPIPAFIGVDADLLPNNDTLVRYVYFVENTTLETLENIIKSIASSTASPIMLKELKAFMITDSAYNIKVLMRIIKELDKVTMPQAMSVLKLKRVDATRVKALYDSLVQQPDQQGTAAGRIVGPRKPSNAQYFPEDARIIAEPRTNSLILLGSHDAISKIEDFIIKNIDIELSTPYSPLHIFPLKYADAQTVANIMNNVAKFGQGSPTGQVAAQTGGVRGQDKYLKPMTFTAEPTSNRVIVRGDYEDFLKAKEIMEKLDEPQAQVAIEVLILSININDAKELGTQLRSKTPGGPDGLLGKNIKFQTSGLRAGGAPQGVITNSNAATGSQTILGNLINLVVGKGPGNTVVSLGTDPFGVWGIFQTLVSVSNTQVLSNPFLLATNKTPAVISLGETRRVVSANVISGNNTAPTFTDKIANLEVKITPQINSDGMIVLALNVKLDQFISPDPTNGAITTKTIDTATIVANKEILALGGLIRNRIEDNVTKTPILGDIPIIGWLFKNKRKQEVKDNLLILISTRIIEPFSKKDVDMFTRTHIQDYRADLQEMSLVVNERDPVDKSFFKEKSGSTSEIMDRHIFKNTEYSKPLQEPKKGKKTRQRTRKQKNAEEKPRTTTPQPTTAQQATTTTTPAGSVRTEPVLEARTVTQLAPKKPNAARAKGSLVDVAKSHEAGENAC